MDAGDLNKRILRFISSRKALAIAILIVLPLTVAAGYTSFLFPVFSAEMGFGKEQITNMFVLGQLVVYLCIGFMENADARFGQWRVTTAAVACTGAVFLLFSLNTTLGWSVAVIVFVAVLGKFGDGWKGLWLKAASEKALWAGAATGAMFAVRSLALVAQPFIMGALLVAADAVAVIIIGAICAVCALVFYLVTRHTSLASKD